MKVATQPTKSTATSSTLVGPTFTSHPEAVELHGSTVVPLQSPFPTSSFIGLGPLFMQGRSNEVSSGSLLDAERPNPSSNIPSTMGHPPGSAAAGSNPSCQQPLRRQSRNRSPPLRPPTNPTNSQASGIATAVTRDSQKDVEAQRGIFPVRFLAAAIHHDCSTRDDPRKFSVYGEYGGVY